MKLRNKYLGTLLCAAMVVMSSQRVHAAGDIWADSVAGIKECHFHARDLVLPAALTGVGLAGVWCFDGFKRSVTHHFGYGNGHGWAGVDRYVQYVPAAAYLGLGCVKLSNLGLGDRAVVAATTAVAVTAMTAGLKLVVREVRPDGSARNSFPSGHAARAFAGAELMRIEYGTAYGAAAYALAVGVAWMRVYNRRHWYCDVVAGAGIGVLSARIGYWMLPLWRRWLHLERTSVAVMPYWQNESHGAGLCLAATF